MLLVRRLKQALFSSSSDELAGPGGFMRKVGQVIYLAVGKFRRDFCLERAASLTFYSIISLIPLAVLFFSFARAMNQGDAIKSWFLDKIPGLVAPGLQKDLSAWLEKYIGSNALVPEGNTDLVNFTAICGLVIISLGIFIAAERVFNHIWQVDRRRNHLQRLLVFWVILTTSPLLAMASLSLDAALDSANIGVLKAVEDSAAFATALGFLAFTSMYFFLPATRVRLGSAMIGGLVAALLWQLSKYGFSHYLERITRVTTFYSQIAAVPLFLIWLYVTWMVILCGAQLSFVHQNLASLSRSNRADTGRRRSLPELGLHLLYRIGAAFSAGQKVPSLKAVAYDLGLDDDEGLSRAADVLLKQNVLLGDSASDSRYILARDPARIELKGVMAGLRIEEFPVETSPVESQGEENRDRLVISRLITEADVSWEGSFESRTLADILPIQEKKEATQVIEGEEDRESD